MINALIMKNVMVNGTDTEQKMIMDFAKFVLKKKKNKSKESLKTIMEIYYLIVLVHVNKKN